MEKLKIDKPKVHVFICVNERDPQISPKPSCGPTINTETFREVKKWIIDEKLVKQVFCNRTYCLGLCNAEGGTVVVYPSGSFYIGVKSIGEIKDIISQELNNINSS